MAISELYTPPSSNFSEQIWVQKCLLNKPYWPIVSLTAEIASITANIDTLKADLKGKKTALKKAEKEVASLEAKKAKAEAKAAEEAKKTEAEAVLKKMLASGMSADEILEKLR